MSTFTHTNPMHDVKALEAQVEDLQQAKLALEARIIGVSNTNTALKGQFNSTLLEAQKLMDYVPMLMAEKAELTRKTALLEAKLADRHEQGFKARRGENAVLNSTVHSLEVRIATLEVERDDAIERAEAAEAENTALLDQLAASEERATSAEAQNEALLQQLVAANKRAAAEAEQRVRSALNRLLKEVIDHLDSRIRKSQDENSITKIEPADMVVYVKNGHVEIRAELEVLRTKRRELDDLIEGAVTGSLVDFNQIKNAPSQGRSFSNLVDTGFFSGLAKILNYLFGYKSETQSKLATAFKSDGNRDNARVQAVSDAITDRANVHQQAQPNPE